MHPTEIAFDLYTAERALEALDHREEFGFNFDPSHLIWQGVDPVEFIRAFPDRIYHVHMKDAIVTLNGRTGILASHLNFGDPRRGWDFRSPGRGGVNFEEIIRALNHVGYDGPLSVEWEDSGMDREHGAKEACEFVAEARLRAQQRGLRRGVFRGVSRAGSARLRPRRYDGGCYAALPHRRQGCFLLSQSVRSWHVLTRTRRRGRPPAPYFYADLRSASWRN